MRIGLAQLDPTVGDVEGNTKLLLDAVQRAKSESVDLLVAPELCVLGYPPKDIVLRRDIVQTNVAAVERIASACDTLTALVGFAMPDPSGEGKGLLNAVAVCRNGRVEATYAKMLLPTYDVFDETRYFSAGREPCVVDVPTKGGAIAVGVTVCEDLWNNRQFEGRRVYGVDPITKTVEAGARLIVNLSASPYRAGVQEGREALFASQARELRVPLVYANQVAGNDDLLFDGTSLVLDANGDVLARAKAFEEDFLVVDLNATSNRIETYPDRIAGIRAGLLLGIRDYVRKCGFTDVVVGLSGGIDSALTAALAVEALGRDRVHGVAMPSRYSSGHSVEDARALAANLGMQLLEIGVKEVHAAYEASLSLQFSGEAPGVAEENIQARIRGTLLMALSNKFGWLLLTTGNKSELAVGYCTLYGDMCGGLAVLSDVPKTVVYELARQINATADTPRIPVRTIDKPPSAELREDQTDQDTLPPYDLLDAVLEQYIEQDRCVDEIIESGFDRAMVERVAQMVRMNEYKRQQAAVGIKVTARAFGSGRRMPIAAKYS